MRNKLDKKNLIIYFKYQLNSALSVSLRSISIYIFTDLMSYSYSFVFWLSFFMVSLNSFFIQKKFVFKSSNKKSLDKFIFVAIFLGSLEYFFSILLLDYFQLNVIPFLIVGFVIYVVRFLLNRNYVFKND
jgi:putative flippase GtrA